MNGCSVFIGGLRRAAAWRPGERTGTQVVKIRCPLCRMWRKVREYRPIGRGCRRCVGTG